MYNPYDFYFKKAKKEWYKARSAFKIQEIDKKYKIFTKDMKSVLDIWCSPWSWSQYAVSALDSVWAKDFEVIGFDIKHSNLNLENFSFYKQDITDLEKIKEIFNKKNIKYLDVIVSDMAANTIWQKDIDAIKTLSLIEESMPLYKEFLHENWKFIIKLFMWPGFEELISDIKKFFGAKRVKVFKPEASRKNSKETYIIKY